MLDKPKRQPDEPTEKTPQGFTVPVPKRADVLANLKKLAKVGKPSSAPGSKQSPS
jgi:hypothetical protein